MCRFSYSGISRLVSLCGILPCALAGGALADCVPPPAGLVAWWPGDGNANDIAGTNNGVLLNGATASAPGVVGQAFSLDGVQAVVNASTNSFFNFAGGAADFTIECWVNPTAWPSFISTCFVSKEAGNYDGWGFGIFSDGALFLSGIGNWNVNSGPAVVPIGAWSHVAVAHSAGLYTLYVNGVQVASGSGGSWTGSAAPLRFGPNPPAQNYNGLLDEVSIYSRGLSSDEIVAIYNAGSAGKCEPPHITVQPASQIGFWGSSVAFQVTAVGKAPLSYQWGKNGTPLTGATTNSLVLTNLQMADAGLYTVTITNVAGSVTSNPAILTMNPAGVSLALYAGVTIEGVVGLTYGIQYTTDLSSTNSWRGQANVTLGVPVQLWFDVQPATQPQRYYRVVPGPIPIP